MTILVKRGWRRYSGFMEDASTTASKPRSEPFLSLQASARLESIRGLAAMTVAMLHCLDVLQSSHSSQRFVAQAMVVFNGHAAVTVFFVLSGLVLGLSLRRSSRPPFPNCVAYFVRRLFRIYPTFLVTTLLIAVLIPLYRHLPKTDGDWTNTYFPEAVSLGAIFQNLTFHVLSFSKVTWTLKMEMICSFLLPLCFYGSRLFRFFPWLLLIAAMAAAQHFNTVISVAVTQAFLVGYLIPETVGCWRLVKTSRIVTLLIFAVSLPLLALPRSTSLSLPSYTIIEAIGAALLIVAMTHGAEWSFFSILDWHPVKVAGQVSYSYYLLHPIVLVPLVAWIFPRLQAFADFHYSLACAVVLWVASSAITFPLAWLSFKLIEKPMIVFSKKFTALSSTGAGGNDEISKWSVPPGARERRGAAGTGGGAER
jgi:peptidoglycan/LPS O-acetylase OafA/YrhL